MDRNLIRPTRNYRAKVSDGKFVMKEDFGNYLAQAALGVGRMFIIENPRDW